MAGDGVRIESKDFYGLAQQLKAFDPALYRGLRRALKDVGSEAVEGVQAKLGESSPAGGPDTGRMRSIIAASTRVVASFAKRGGSVKITTSGSGLPAEHKAILAAYNTKGSWRHPVFGDRETWQSQPGRPYFYGPVMKAGHREMKQGIQTALDDAVRAIGAR